MLMRPGHKISLVYKSNVDDLYIALIFTLVLLHMYLYPGFCPQGKQVYGCLVISLSSSINAILRKQIRLC